MTSADDDSLSRFTKDDEAAIRVASLAYTFMSAHRPVSSARIHDEFYADRDKNDSFRKAFKRDRDTLDKLGIHIVEVKNPNAASSWIADETRSWVADENLTRKEIISLELACDALLDCEDFSNNDELRYALAKLNSDFLNRDYAPRTPQTTNEFLATFRSCLKEPTHAAKIRYKNVKGEEKEHVLAPYGIYGLYGHQYLIALPINEGIDSPRTYRLDRILSIDELNNLPTEIPSDFDIQVYYRLPFQVYEKQPSMVTFVVPVERERELKTTSLGKGTFRHDSNTLYWNVEAANLDDAATWAVAQGIRPIAPEELVVKWQEVLKGVLA